MNEDYRFLAESAKGVGLLFLSLGMLYYPIWCSCTSIRQINCANAGGSPREHSAVLLEADPLQGFTIIANILIFLGFVLFFWGIYVSARIGND